MRTLSALLLVLPCFAGCALTLNGKSYNMTEAFTGSSAPAPQPAQAATSAPRGVSAAEAAAQAASMPPGGVIEFDRAAVPNPFIIDIGAVPTTRSSTQGYAACSNDDSYMSQAPVARLVVKERTRLRMLSRNSGLIALPDSRFVCYEHKTLGATGLISAYEGDYEPGTYDIYAMGKSGQQVPTHVEFTLVDRVPQDAAARLAAAPVIEAKLAGTLNPAWATISVGGAAYLPGDLKLDCSGPTPAGWPSQPRGLLVPAARLRVTDASTWRLEAPERGVFLRAPDGRCLPGGGNLARGDYDVFVSAAGEAQAQVDLAVIDGERGLALGEAPHVEVRDLKQPLAVPVVVPAPQFRSSQLCGAGAHTPSFYLDVKSPLAKVSLTTLVADAELDWAVAGPLEASKREYEWCKASGHGRSWDTLEKGTYAVWVSSKTGVGQKAWAKVRQGFEDHVVDQKARGEPLTKLAPIPAELSLKERQVWWHYPYHPRDTAAVEALFLDAPAQLFVFLTGDAESVKAGEALLLTRWGQEKSTVLRANGETKEVRTERLTTEKPATALLPDSWPDIAPPANIKEGYQITSPLDLPKFAKWENEEARRYACVDNWMRKNDPTWGKNYDVVNLRTGETMTDRKFRQADKVCQSARVQAAEKALVKAAHQSRLALREKVKKTLLAKLR